MFTLLCIIILVFTLLSIIIHTLHSSSSMCSHYSSYVIKKYFFYCVAYLYYYLSRFTYFGSSFFWFKNAPTPRDSVKFCSRGSNEPPHLKIKILYIYNIFFISLFTLKNIFEHPNLNFAYPNHK